MSLSQSQRLQYLVWAATKSASSQEHQCPACTSVRTALVRRKYLVTSLWECQSCGLRFRSPKDNVADAHDFYQASYSQGLTTDCPTEEALSALVAKNFSDSEKDFQCYINVLKAAGMVEGDSLGDTGAGNFERLVFGCFLMKSASPEPIMQRPNCPATWSNPQNICQSALNAFSLLM
jgi:ribosomal protein L37AE/L43A